MAIKRSKVINYSDEDFVPTSITDIVNSYRQIIVDTLREKLKEVDRYATGNLYETMHVDIAKGESIISFELKMDEYWKFIDKGVDGTVKKHGSPYKYRKKNIKQDAVRKFMTSRRIEEISWKNKDGEKVTISAKKKNIKVRKKGLDSKARKERKTLTREGRLKSIAYVIGRGIARNGLKPTHFYTDTINDVFVEKFKSEIAKAFKGDVLVSIRDIKKALNG